MIGRLLLGLFAVSILVSGFSDIKTSGRAGRTATAFSSDHVGEIDPKASPFVQINDIQPSDAVCLYTVNKDEPEGIKTGETTYAPILTAAQVEAASDGKPVVATAVIKLDGCEEGSAPKDVPSSVIGLASRGQSDVPVEISNELAKDKISFSPDVLVVEQRDKPPTAGGGAGKIATALALFAVAVIPFFGARRRLDERRVSGGALATVIKDVRPLISCSPDVLAPAELQESFLNGGVERILLKVNGSVGGIPSLLIITNRRLLIYRTQSNVLPTIGRVVSRLLDTGAEKVPGGGLVMLAIEPFFETFDVLFLREEAGWRENLGFEDAEILQGSVPWKKLSDVELVDLPKAVKSVWIGKDWLLRSASVRFYPRSLGKLFSLPKDFDLSDFVGVTAINRIAAELQPLLTAAGCTAVIKPRSLDLALPAWKKAALEDVVCNDNANALRAADAPSVGALGS